MTLRGPLGIRIRRGQPRSIAAVSLLCAVAVVWGTAGVVDAGTAEGEHSAEDPRGGVVNWRNGTDIHLASGAEVRVRISDNLRQVTVSRKTVGAGWSAPRRLLANRDLTCGSIEAAVSASSIALTVACDRNYSEDQAPTRSQALVSTDAGRTWASRRLPGEAYQTPAIAPAGQAASWPLGQGKMMTWTPGRFALRQVPAPDQEYDETTVSADSGSVSYVYLRDTGERCELIFVALASDGSTTQQVVPLASAPGCGTEGILATIDANTVAYSDMPNSPEHLTTVGRTGDDDPWAVTAGPPIEAPGYAFGPQFGQVEYFRSQSDPAKPLTALGFVHNRRLVTQTYNEESARWNPPVTVRRFAKPCGIRDPHKVQDPAYLLFFTCSKRFMAAASTDGIGWTTIADIRNYPGIGSRGVALTRRDATTVVTRGRIVTLPLGSQGRCEQVMVRSPHSAVLLTSSDGNGWPDRLRMINEQGWGKTQHLRLPRFSARCANSQVANGEIRPPTYWMANFGANSGYEYTWDPGEAGRSIRIIGRLDG